jgi:WD40 repeat protein
MWQDQTLAVGSADGRLSLWDPASPTASLISVLTYGDGASSTIAALCVLSSGQLVSGSFDASVAVWQNGYNQPSSLA